MSNEMLGNDNSEEHIIKEVEGAGVIKEVDMEKISPHIIERDNQNKELIDDNEQALRRNEKEIDELIKDFDEIRKNFNNKISELSWDSIEGKVNNFIHRAEELQGISKIPSQKEQLQFHIESMQEFLNYNQPK